MGYAATKGVILYWKTDQPSIINIYHHVCFDECNFHLSISYKHTPGSLLLQKYPEGHTHDSDLLKLIQCKIDLTSTPFSDETIIIYEIELLPSGNKIGLI